MNIRIKNAQTQIKLTVAETDVLRRAREIMTALEPYLECGEDDANTNAVCITLVKAMIEYGTNRSKPEVAFSKSDQTAKETVST